MAKSKKDKEDEFANEIEAENRKNDQDDPSSGEEGQGEEEDEDEDDEDAMLKKNAKREIVVKEEDYEENEKLNFSADVYNFTICANMTKCCSPVQQSFALYKCLFVFSIQVLVPVFFVLEFGLTNFKWPKRESMATRLICSLLLHMIIFGELKQALSVLRYLKFVKTAQGGRRGRAINILLCSMQCISPLVAETVLMLAIAQEESLSMIIKSFVALGFVIKVDDMFSENFPEEI